MTSETPATPPPGRSQPGSLCVDASLQRLLPGRPSRSVLFRLLFVAVAAVFTVHLAGALVIAGAASKSAERQLDDRLTTILDSRAKLMAAPLWKLQYENVAAILKELAGNPAIVSGAVYDDAGAVVASTNQDGDRGPTTPRS